MPGAHWGIRNKRSQRQVAARVETAFDSATRNKGLLGRDALAADTALILAPCNSIHTFFMRFPIDALFVARDGRVIKVRRAMPAWRIAIALRAYAVVELAAGAADLSDTRVNDLVELTAE